MRIAVLLIVLIGTAAGYKSTQYSYFGPTSVPKEVTEELLLKDLETSTSDTPVVSTTTTTSEKPSTAATQLLTSSAKPLPEAPIKEEEEAIIAEIPSELPVSLAPPSLPIDEGSDALKRRIINYDQRQEGQYNIRADLENFMIVLIPPSPSEGLNLLDLLTKSALRRTSHGSKGKRKHSAAGGSAQSTSSKYRHALKPNNLNQNFNYISRQQPDAFTSRNYLSASQLAPHHAHHVSTLESAGSSSQQRLSDFIEGRTPYHVDISASDDEQSRLHPDRQVDVLPPPYPLGYQQLIKPYLEAEPTVIQALPPTELSVPHSTAGFLDNYNQLLASGLQANADLSAASSDGSGYYRLSRAIRGDHFLDSNRIATAANSLVGARRTDLPLYRSELSSGANTLYPPIDVPHFNNAYPPANSNSRKYELKPSEQNLEDSREGELFVQPEDDIELEWRGVGVMDASVRDLLSEYMVRCAPGHLRDSYGVCREVEGY